MVRTAGILLSMSVATLGDGQKRMILNTDHAGMCVYCHSDGDAELYGCDTGYNDQKFYLQQIPPSDVGGRTNGYLIVSADNGLCLATTGNEKIFGWSDCSTSDQGGNGDRSWLLNVAADGLHIESARYPNWCMATQSGWNLFRYPCGDVGQTWVFDPPFNPDGGHGTPITSPEGYWHAAASNNGDISKSLTIGMSWTDGTTVTSTDQVGLSYALEAEGVFMGVGAKETLGATYSHTWSNAVMQSSTTTSSEECTATCHLSDLPSGSPGWNLFQWEMRGTASKGVVSTRTCDYLCVPQPFQPRCPVNCCQDRNCQTCDQSCFNDAVVVSFV